MSPVRCYASFQDHKKCRKVLKNVTLPTKCPLLLQGSGKEYRSPRRLGLSLSRLPKARCWDPTRCCLLLWRSGAKTARGDFLSMRCRMEHKQAAIVSEPLRAIKEMASQQPSSKWQPGTETWVKLRSWREERGHAFGGENVMLSSPVSFLKPSMPPVKPRPQTDFHRPWSAHRSQGEKDGTLPPLQRYAKVCMDCGLQPQQAVVGFLGRQLPFLDLRSLSYSDEDLLMLCAAYPESGILERLDLGDNSKISDRSVCPLLQCAAARHGDMLRSLRLDRCTHIGRKCIQLLTRLIHGPMQNLERLDISGVYVSVCDYQKLANAIERHEHLREVSLARTGISPDLSTKEEDPEKAGRRLLVIGCGPSGIQILRQLWKDFEVGVNQELKTNEGCDSDRSPVKLVTLVEPKDYYEFTPGILRGLCHPQHLETLLLPLEDALAGMRVNHIKGRVVRLSERSAQVDSPVHGLMAVDFDYAVVAVGSQYAGNSLWKVSGAAEADELSLIGRRKSLEAMRQNLEDLEKEQKTLVLLGAGLVGVELAAEVKHYFPTLRVVLADRSQTVLPVLPKDAQDYAQTWLKEHGVDLRLGCELPRDETALLKALEIDEAKVLLCAGLGFHAGMAATLECVDASGQITTNRFMQCIDSKGHPSADGRIFALGDCVNVRGTEMRFTKEMNSTGIASSCGMAESSPLDLGYNHFDPEAFSVLGNSLFKGSQIEHLGLAKTASVLAYVPMSGFLEQLPADKSLKFLDLADNMLDENAAMMLEYGLQTHPSIELLDVSNNPLGQGGLGSMARLLSSDKSPHLGEIRMDDVQATEDRDAAVEFFEVDPSGQYRLDLTLPGPRTSFRLLLSQLSDMGSRSQYIKSATLTTSPKTPPAPYNVDAVRKRKNIWTVPTAGVLDFVLNISDFLLKDEGENERLYSAVVERMFLKRRDGRGDKAKETLLRMLPTLMSPYALMHAARNTDSIQEMLDFEKVAAEHMALNLENPTGHYALRLESLPARVVAQHLLLLNRWQLHLWRKANLVDVSMDGKGHLRKFLGWADIDWRLPASGQLTFDFVALYRPPADASPVASDAWGQVLAALADLLAPKIREGNQEDPSVRRQVAKVQWAMRAISSRVWLLTRQLRNLLCIFLNRQDRGEVMSTFFLRCVDWPINGKCCQPKFTRHHWKDLSQRLGYMNLFPYGQPEMSFHIIDLEQWEQRRCFHNLVRLANWEDSVNIKNPMMDKDANPNAPAFQPFVAGIPNSWAELENIPTQGLVQCTYTCSVDRQNLKARRRLAASVGGWTNLPDTTFDFWSCLEDVPVEVLKAVIDRVVTFMIRTWKSTDAAFSALNTQPDNMLNHKEFVDGLTKAGCCKPKRWTGRDWGEMEVVRYGDQKYGGGHWIGKNTTRNMLWL
ncbi:Type II NADH:quinone oxidoreductase (NDH-2) [Durusdinium trenchii]|uniref:Type II NADH:quinone oxidoreductase (NDH-2) n=1 Tax=Durusdinium trenchii TaxID=1381693 RepID=A0ABP0SKQ1_9DINO